MKLNINITEWENDAFQDGNSDRDVGRIYQRIYERINNGETSGKILDVNGNAVGTWNVDNS